MAGGPRISLYGEVQTTGVGPLNVTWSHLGSVDIAIADNTMYMFDVHGIGRGTAGVERFFYNWLVSKVYRQGGAAPVVSNLTATASETSAITDPTWTASGNNLRLAVTGIGATTINWTFTGFLFTVA